MNIPLACEIKIHKFNYLDGGPVIRVWTKMFSPSVVSGSSPVIAHMMAPGGLHDH
jgi:hypothetical protein